MKLAIMQPYLFPYLGYFQLIHAVDRFVAFDDVHFIKRGWINRNRILVNGEPAMFTLPLKGASQNRRIHEISLSPDADRWRAKFIATLKQAYSRAPHFDHGLALVEEVLNSPAENLADFLFDALQATCRTLGIQTELVRSSQRHDNLDLRGEDRILDICERERATCYINPPGGVELYNTANFAERGVALRFLKPGLPPYDQQTAEHVAGLSILDVLMFNDPETYPALLDAYSVAAADEIETQDDA